MITHQKRNIKPLQLSPSCFSRRKSLSFIMENHAGQHNGHNHSVQTHSTSKSGYRKLWIALWINLAFLIIEFIGGLVTNSLALLADAGHMLTDVAALALALFAAYLMKKPHTPRRTFGFLRAEVLGAFINAAALVLICGLIVIEALKRLGAQPHVDGPVMLVIAAGGLAVNLTSALVLSSQRHSDMNMRGAFLHMVADTLGSIGAITGGAVIWIWNWTLIDPLISLFIVVLILYSSLVLLKDAANVLLEATPSHLDYTQIKKALESVPVVHKVHELHIWTITTGMPSLSAHLELKNDKTDADSWRRCLGECQCLLAERFNIRHSTLQIEPAGFCNRSDLCHPM